MRDILGVIAWILRFSPLINAHGKEKGASKDEHFVYI